MAHDNIANFTAQKHLSRPDYNRPNEHKCASLRLLEGLRQAALKGVAPSTAELQDERIYGLRPVNRIGGLIRGKHNHTRYDIERIDCSHGVYRWRLHEPARHGYPKSKNQSVLPLSSPKADWYEREHGHRPVTQIQAEDLPLFAEVSR
jgi:hypothetical protein